MPSFSKVIIIYNPNSTGKSEQNALKLQRILKKRLPTIVCHVIPTEYAGHAEELATKFASEHADILLVSSSGDGGYNEVINGVMQAGAKASRVVCAVLASGNANDHSRTMQSQPLWRAIVSDEVVHIDLLRITITNGTKTTTRFAHSYAGLGITSAVAKELKDQPFSARRELATVVKTFIAFEPFEILQGGKKLKLDSLVFSNINKIAKVFKLSKQNTPSNGKFRITMFVHLQKRVLAASILKAAFGRLEKEVQESSYEFKTLSSMPIQLDGEIMQLPKGCHVCVTAESGALATIV